MVRIGWCAINSDHGYIPANGARHTEPLVYVLALVLMARGYAKHVAYAIAGAVVMLAIVAPMMS